MLQSDLLTYRILSIPAQRSTWLAAVYEMATFLIVFFKEQNFQTL